MHAANYVVRQQLSGSPAHGHHLEARQVVVGPVAWVGILGLALAELLARAVRAVNAHEALSLGLEHVLGRVVEPAVDKVAVNAVAVSDLAA